MKSLLGNQWGMKESVVKTSKIGGGQDRQVGGTLRKVRIHLLRWVTQPVLVRIKKKEKHCQHPWNYLVILLTGKFQYCILTLVTPNMWIVFSRYILTLVTAIFTCGAECCIRQIHHDQ